jgi:CHASE2 domain-containing sensor protein
VQLSPPVLTLKAEDLFRDKDYIAKNGDPAAMIPGRFIFVGARLAGLNDQVLSAIHGYMPGVYKHAMALDNFVTYGASYPTVPRPWLLGILVFVTYGLIEVAKEFSANLQRRRIVISAVTLVSVFVWSFVVFALRWPPSLIFAIFAYYASGVLFLKAAGSRSRRTSSVYVKRGRKA